MSAVSNSHPMIFHLVFMLESLLFLITAYEHVVYDSLNQQVPQFQMLYTKAQHLSSFSYCPHEAPRGEFCTQLFLYI